MPNLMQTDLNKITFYEIKLSYILEFIFFLYIFNLLFSKI